MANIEKTNNAKERPEQEVPAEKKGQEVDKPERGKPPETKKEQAVEIARKINENRESRSKLEQALIKTKDAKGKQEIVDRLNSLNRETHDLVGKARGVLSPDLEQAVKQERDRLDKLSKTDQAIDFEKEQARAKQLEEEGKAKHEPITEVAGIVLAVEIEERRQLAEQQVKVQKLQTEATEVTPINEIWSQIQAKKEQISVEFEDSDGVARVEEELDRLTAAENKLIAEALKTDSELQADKEKLDELQERTKDPKEGGAAQGELEEYVAKAVEQDETGLRAHYLEQRAGEIKAESARRNPALKEAAAARQRIEQKRVELLERLDKGEIGPEDVIRGGEQLREAQREAERALIEQLAGASERGKVYEPLPKKTGTETQKQYEDRLEIWVWKKIQAIDNASISPSALVYSPAYTSLLYALTETALPDRLKNNINAWRGVYEVAMVWDGSGRPEDVLARAADMDPDTFMGLIGQYQRDEDGNIRKDPDGKPLFTEQAKEIQRAFAKLDEHGYELTHGSSAESRRAIHAEIAKTLDRDAPEDKKFGAVYERIAYRFWKFLGREGRFDRVVIEADKDIKVSKDKKVFVYRKSIGADGKEITRRIPIAQNGLILKGDLVSVSRTGDEIAARRKVDSRYNSGFSKTSIKFWYRRLVGDESVGGLRQEKNIKFLPKLFDHISYGIKDFITDQMGLKEDQMGNKKEKGDDGCVERVTTEDLSALDWENRTGTYTTWVDDLRKAAETRKELIKPAGFLDIPERDTKKIFSLKEVFDTFGDKSNTALPEIINGFIEIHRKIGILPKFVNDEVGFRLAWSDAQETTGVGYPPMNRGDIEDFIDQAVTANFISAAKGEELKRKWLAVLGIPGIGPVRFSARLAEGVSNPGNIFGVFWATFSTFLGTFLESIIPFSGGGGGGKKKR